MLVFCNKQDLEFSKKAVSIEKEMEKEIEELRKVKKVTQDEASKLGYLETLKKKFSFGDMQVPIKFVEGSIKNEELGEIYKFISLNF